jgi:hypothetical protein
MQAHLWNSLEDWRVEELLASIFPGCRQHFQRLIQHYFGKKDDGSDANPALAILHWVLLTVRSWAVPALAQHRDKEAAVIDSVFPGLRAKLEAVFVRIQQRCRNTQEAIAYALELAAIIEKYAQQPQAQQVPQESKSGNPDSQRMTDTHEGEAEQTESLKDAEKENPPDAAGEPDTKPDSANQSAAHGSPDTLDTPDTEDMQEKNEQPTPDMPDTSDGHKSEAQSVEHADAHAESKATGDADAQADAQEEGQGNSTDSASQAEPDGGTVSQAQSLWPELSQRLTELLQASADALPQHLGELMAQNLSAQHEYNAHHGLSVARIGYKSTTPLPKELKEAALQSCVALRTRLQALLQAKTQQPCITGRKGKLHHDFIIVTNFLRRRYEPR